MYNLAIYYQAFYCLSKQTFDRDIDERENCGIISLQVEVDESYTCSLFFRSMVFLPPQLKNFLLPGGLPKCMLMK